jgi:salicylate hydroxylase
VHRAAFLDALVSHIDPARTHFDKRCIRLSSEGGATILHFKDGSTARADVVVGADGIKSVVRRFVVGTEDQAVDPNLKFSNTICYRNLIPVSKVVAAGAKFDYMDRPACFTGKNAHLICFTVRAKTLVRTGSHVDTLALL